MTKPLTNKTPDVSVTSGVSLFRQQRLNLRAKLISIGYPHLRVYHTALPIHHEKRRHRAHAESPRRAQANRVHQVQPQHARASLEVAFQPIHDGLGHQARASKIRIKLDDLGRAIGKQGIQFLRRSHPGRRRAQKHNRQRERQQEYQQHPMLSNELHKHRRQAAGRRLRSAVAPAAS